MKLYFRKLLVACLALFCLSLSVHAAQDNNYHAVGNNNQQTILALNQAPYMGEHLSFQHQYSDELWLIGSFLVSVTGFFILVRFLHR